MTAERLGAVALPPPTGALAATLPAVTLAVAGIAFLAVLIGAGYVVRALVLMTRARATRDVAAYAACKLPLLYAAAAVLIGTVGVVLAALTLPAGGLR